MKIKFLLFAIVLLNYCNAQISVCETPFALFNGHSSGATVKISEVKITEGLSVKVNNIPCYDYVITSFNTRFYIDNTCYTSAESGMVFSQNLKDELAKSKPGSLLIFDDIIVKDRSGKHIAIAPLMIKVF